MDRYKKVIKLRILLLSILVIFSVILGIYDVFLTSPEVKESDLFSFQCGSTSALGLLGAIIIIRYRGMLRDEKKLKLQFNKEKDERLKAIRAKAGMPILLVTSVLMIIAGVIAGYFNATIFVTLIIAAVGQMIISGFVKMIYMRKM